MPAFPWFLRRRSCIFDPREDSIIGPRICKAIPNRKGGIYFAAAVAGSALALVGCLVLSPVVYVGVAVILVSLAGAIAANVLYNRNDMDRAAATVASTWRSSWLR